MQVEWYGQSAFRLAAGGRTVVIDPFGDMSAVAARGLRFDYPPIRDIAADLLLVTHEHRDHNAVDAIAGDPVVVRSAAGRHPTPIGEVLGIASEHDDAAGTERGANVLYAFDLGGVRVAHLGDLGQAALRPAQAAALGRVDLLLVPVGGGPTIGAEQAATIARDHGARWIVPMHYRSERISFLEPVDAFVAGAERVVRPPSPRFALDEVAGDGPTVVVPAAP
ncbi:MBL fold metallo-hydrolase [Patulibacter defluvii]|uniref:MBL fold metallo-hydrolase n=1 Tax=Patulibacter defluvii TaxID=3095358 RepID=UPI002A76300E|nr:MBL fold metallo-hydrolase [Patulibacter sp. DM4]